MNLKRANKRLMYPVLTAQYASLHQRRRMFLFLLPVVLLFTTAIAFSLASMVLGKSLGYFTGFIFYWIFWCLVVPIRLVGLKALTETFRIKTAAIPKSTLLILLVPLLFVYAYAFPTAVKEASTRIILFSLLLSLVNATLEEVLWRATYLVVFRNEKRLGILASALGFAVWHYAPQLVFANKNPGGAHSFVLVAFFLGWLYAWAIWKQQSIFWVTIAHVLFDFAGLGARIYF
jgi:membrane protease YdiL (CAAX protease family)